MEFKYQYQGERPLILREFLVQKQLPSNFIKSVKYQGGQMLVNQQPVTVRYMLQPNDLVTIVAPVEVGHETVIASNEPLDIHYEDRDFLIVNKPAGLLSIPSMLNPDDSVANRLKGYYQQKAYPDQVIHVVTRLDKDTTGLMLIAKHRLAHAFFDRQLREGKLTRQYLAISHRSIWPDHGFIDSPIARSDDSIITRTVSPTGQAALTEFWLQNQYSQGALLKLQLYTGRTHQIRVHLSHLEGALIGDTLYGGVYHYNMQRPALHCHLLAFHHPFTEQPMLFRQELPDDMQQWINNN